MNSNIPKDPVFHRYPYSDGKSECESILAWFDTHLILTTDDGVHALKIAQLSDRIRTLREKGYPIDRARGPVGTADGKHKVTTIYFLRRKLYPGSNSVAELSLLIDRVPGFEKTDIDHLPGYEQSILHDFLRKLE
jgi:hypothetical protein